MPRDLRQPQPSPTKPKLSNLLQVDDDTFAQANKKQVVEVVMEVFDAFLPKQTGRVNMTTNKELYVNYYFLVDAT